MDSCWQDFVVILMGLSLSVYNLSSIVSCTILCSLIFNLFFSLLKPGNDNQGRECGKNYNERNEFNEEQSKQEPFSGAVDLDDFGKFSCLLLLIKLRHIKFLSFLLIF